MNHDDLLRSGLKTMVTRIEEFYLGGEGKVSFGDVLKLIQRKDLDEKLHLPEHVRAQWVEKIELDEAA